MVNDHVLCYLHDGKIEVFNGSKSACILRSNIVRADDYLIFDKDGDIFSSNLTNLAFLDKIFGLIGGK